MAHDAVRADDSPGVPTGMIAHGRAVLVVPADRVMAPGAALRRHPPRTRWLATSEDASHLGHCPHNTSLKLLRECDPHPRAAGTTPRASTPSTATRGKRPTVTLT